MYTRDALVSAMQDLTSDLGRVPKPSEMDARDGMPDGKWFLSYFGTWNNAVREAGFEPEGPIEETYSETQARKAV